MDPIAIATALIELLLNIVSHSDAKELLDSAAVKRANLAADIAERAKFGPAPTD